MKCHKTNRRRMRKRKERRRRRRGMEEEVSGSSRWRGEQGSGR